MKVIVEREIDLEWLIQQLDDRSKMNPVGMNGYEVTVNKQLLRDAHDVIVQFRKETPNIEINTNGISHTYRT